MKKIMIHTLKGVLSGTFEKCDLFSLCILKKDQKMKIYNFHKDSFTILMCLAFFFSSFLILVLCISSAVLHLSTHMAILQVSLGLSSVR